MALMWFVCIVDQVQPACQVACRFYLVVPGQEIYTHDDFLLMKVLIHTCLVTVFDSEIQLRKNVEPNTFIDMRHMRKEIYCILYAYCALLYFTVLHKPTYGSCC